MGVTDSHVNPTGFVVAVAENARGVLLVLVTALGPEAKDKDFG